MTIVRDTCSYISAAVRSKACLSIMLVCSLLMTSACERSLLTQLVRPTPYGIADTPDGSPEFKQGWEDGCHTGYASYGNNRYKAAYSFTQDPELVDNSEYYRAWQDGQLYCRWYTFGWVAKAER